MVTFLTHTHILTQQNYGQIHMLVIGTHTFHNVQTYLK